MGLAACGSDDDTDPGATDTTVSEDETTTTAAEGSGGEVEVQAVEYGFVLPETLPAGETTFAFKNNGKEPHQLILVPLLDDAPPVEDLIKLSQKEGAKYFKGRPSETSAKPGEEGKPLEVTLEAGRYGYVCFVRTKESKKPHAFLGMYGELTVE
jgi:plastocyanin